MYSEHIFLRYRWQLVCNERMGIHTSPQQLSVFKGLAELDCGKLSTLDWYSDISTNSAEFYPTLKIFGPFEVFSKYL